MTSPSPQNPQPDPPRDPFDSSLPDRPTSADASVPGTRNLLARASEVFFSVRELEPEARGRAVDARCAGEPELRSLVLLLLKGDAAPLPFDSLALELEAARGDLPTSHTPPPQTGDAPGGAFLPAECIGNYRLIRRLGEGGFGVVYLAEQERPVRRQVALKVLKPGMDTQQVITRFEAERQALAMMDHPNIARVFDAGATDRGRPYFVMELVKGEPITAFCDRHRLDIRQRLELFRSVCDAVQHAHQKGVIHRDIKPSNVLVGGSLGAWDQESTLSSEDPLTVKIIDFGIAKAINQRLGEQTVFTHTGQFIGTPEYMSPEQADGRGDIDTRTDVYALGVLLYELLTGSTPFDSRMLRSAAFVELLRIIREDDPPRPSTRLSSLDAGHSGSVAAHRRSRPDALAAELRRELEWIPLKAMRKDRSDRYESAAAIARDISNYLSGFPLEAGPESRVYRARKFIRRRRGLVIAVSSVAASLLLGITGFAWKAHEARIDRDAAIKAQQYEARARRTNESTLQFILSSLRSSDPNSGGEQDMLVSQAMSSALTNLESGAFGDIEQVRPFLLQAIADILSGNGHAAEALPLAEQAVRETLAITAADPDLPNALVLESNVKHTLAVCLGRVGRRAEALALHEELLATSRRQHPGDHPETVRFMDACVVTLGTLGRHAEALPLAQDAVAMAKRLGPQPTTPAEPQLESSATGNMAGLLGALGRADEAIELYEQVIARELKTNPDGTPWIAAEFTALGNLLRDSGKYQAAMERYQRALSIFTRCFKGDHPRIATINSSIGNILSYLGREEESVRMQEEALAMLRRLYAGDHPEVATVLSGIGHALWKSNRPAEAVPKFEESLAMFQRLYPGDHPKVANDHGNLATALMDLDKPAEALPHAEAALAMYQRLYPDANARVATAHNNVAGAYAYLGRVDDAIAHFSESLEINRRLFKGDHPNIIAALGNIGVLCENAGRPADALPRHEEALAMSRRLYPGDNKELAIALFQNSNCLSALNRHADAIPLLEELLAMKRRMIKGDHADLIVIIMNLGIAKRETGAFDEAEQLFRDGIAMRQRLSPEPPGEHPQIATARRHMALLRVKQGRINEALEEAKAAAAMAARLLPENNPMRQRCEATLRDIENMLEKPPPGTKPEAP